MEEETQFSVELIDSPVLVLCKICIYWIKLPKSVTKRCLKHAPDPEIGNSLGDVTQRVAWPAPEAEEGCFEGLEKKEEKITTEKEMVKKIEESDRSYNVNTKMSNCI
jgi:hypothetical protein